MLNFIIYEDSKCYMDKAIKSINVTLGNYDIDYRIYKFSKYCDELKEIISNKELRKIYILDVEVENLSGIELAAKIREEDWDSILIIATAYNKYQNDVFYTRLMVLDFICKYNGYEKRLMDSVKTAVQIIDKEKTFVFKYNHVLYRVPYDQINYIEKEPVIKRCIIHTHNNSFYIVGSINGIIEKLDGNFCKTHQACIVNLDNVNKADMSKNILYFKNGDSTTLLTEKMKKEVKSRVGIS